MNKKFYPKGIEKSGVHALIQNDQILIVKSHASEKFLVF